MLEAKFLSRSLSADFRSVVGLAADIGAKLVEGGSFEDYGGEYTVTPSLADQVLDTEKKTTRQDIVVKAIPYYEVSNPMGETVIIGG